MGIKKGDLVKVISGSKDKKGKIGHVLEICVKKNRVKIEGVAPIKRHLKPQRDKKHPEGGVIDDFGSVHLSNVMLMSESMGRPVRSGNVIDDAGMKIRVARGQGSKNEAV